MMPRSAKIPRLSARILIVDDHPIVRQGYAELIGSAGSMEVCGMAGGEFEALRQVKLLSPDLVLVDISLHDGHGLSLVKQITARYRDVKTLVISAHHDVLFARRALEVGALGYIDKQEASERLIAGIRAVLRGEVYVSESMTAQLFAGGLGQPRGEGRLPLDALTARELEVLERIGRGDSTDQIARRLHVTAKTIERHKANLKQKLGIANATELLQQATRWILEDS